MPPRDTPPKTKSIDDLLRPGDERYNTLVYIERGVDLIYACAGNDEWTLEVCEADAEFMTEVEDARRKFMRSLQLAMTGPILAGKLAVTDAPNLHTSAAYAYAIYSGHYSKVGGAEGESARFGEIMEEIIAIAKGKVASVHAAEAEGNSTQRTAG